ncbi:MAG: hypothetical protein EBR90_02500 [Actinobacteria bacterium]|nr:hypothetical protein [Actinomycetota bacterium]
MNLISEGLNQMRGPNVPRLVLELICAKILINSASQPNNPKPQHSQEVLNKPSSTAAIKSQPGIRKSSNSDITDLHKFWPEVIDNVKQKRRLTWSLLSSSAKVISTDETSITIGIINAGARDSFIRSGSDEILAKAFEEVVGVKKKIEVAIDESVIKPDLNQGEDLEDKPQISAEELLAKELGAKVIKE